MRCSIAIVAASVAVASATEFEWAKIARQVQAGEVEARAAPLYPRGNSTGPAPSGTGAAGPSGTGSGGSPTGSSPGGQVSGNAAAGLSGPAAAGIIGLVGLLAL